MKNEIAARQLKSLLKSNRIIPSVPDHADRAISSVSLLVIINFKSSSKFSKKTNLKEIY